MNESKKRDPRFWRRWRNSGAVFSNLNIKDAEKYRNFMCVPQLPKIPGAIKPLRIVNGETQEVPAVIIAGLNLVGKDWYMCPTVTILGTKKSGKIFGWSLCIGHPEQDVEAPYYFEMSEEGIGGTARGTELPNTMIYFQTEIDHLLPWKGHLLKNWMKSSLMSFHTSAMEKCLRHMILMKFLCKC